MAIGDILSGFAQAGHEHQTNLIQMAYKQRDQLASAYQKLMQDESYPEAARTQFGQAFQDIVTSDPFKLPKVIKKYQDMTISVQSPTGPPVKAGAQTGDAGPTAGMMHAGQQELQPAGIDAKSIAVPPPAPEQRSIMSPLAFEEQMSRLKQTEQIKDQGALDIAKAKAGEWKRQTDLARDMPDGKRHKFVIETRVNPETGESERREVDLGELANFAPRMGDLVTLDDAKKNRDGGFFDFKDINGEDLDLDAMVSTFGPYAVIRNKGAYYEPATQKMTFQTFGNQRVAVNPLAPQAPGQVLGTAVPEKTTTRPTVVPNTQGGRSIVYPTSTSSVQTGTPGVGAPAAPPMATSPTTTTPAAPVQPQVAPGTGAPPVAPQAPPIAKPAGGKAGSLKATPIEGSMNPGEYNRQAKIVTSIKPALNTLMGDPENPGFKGMDQFANLVDSAESQDRLGQAARLIIHELADTGSGGSGIGATVFGTGISIGGGLITALENTFGVTGWKASTSGKVIDKAMEGLSPDERQFLDRIIGAYGTVVGLRAVTSGSALQFNTKLMEKELPIPGISGAITRRQFYDKLAQLAGEPLSSTKTFDPNVFVDREHYLKSVHRFTALGNGETVVVGKGGNPDLVLRNGKWVPLK